MPYLPAVELEWPKGLSVTASVIWLHGLGADGNDFAPIVPQLNLPAGVGVRFIFPHAPSIPPCAFYSRHDQQRVCHASLV